MGCGHGRGAGGMAAEGVLRYLSAERRELDKVFDFGMAEMGERMVVEAHETWKHTLPEFKGVVGKAQGFLKGGDAWATVFAENHDQWRSLSRFANDNPVYREKAAKMLAIMFGRYSEALFIYQGQGVGTVNAPKEWGPEYLRDIAALNYWQKYE